MNQIQRDYEDGKFLAKAIRTGVLEMYKKPRRERSILADEDERAFEQETFNQDYKNATSKYERKIKNLQDNMASSYILIFEDYCTKDLQQRIEQHPEFKEKIRDDPVELVNTIKVLIQSPVRREYRYHPLKAALVNFMTIKQYDEEDAVSYTHLTLPTIA